MRPTSLVIEESTIFEPANLICPGHAGTTYANLWTAPETIDCSSQQVDLPRIVASERTHSYLGLEFERKRVRRQQWVSAIEMVDAEGEC